MTSYKLPLNVLKNTMSYNDIVFLQCHWMTLSIQCRMTMTNIMSMSIQIFHEPL